MKNLTKLTAIYGGCSCNCLGPSVKPINFIRLPEPCANYCHELGYIAFDCEDNFLLNTDDSLAIYSSCVLDDDLAGDIINGIIKGMSSDEE